MATFWRHGYDATTYKLLEEVTGVGVKSLHNVFGEKEDLFVRVLKIYREMAEGIIAKVFDPPSPDAIIVLFQSMSLKTEAAVDIANAGCLMVNSVFELGKTSDAIRVEIDGYREMWRRTFETSLKAGAIADANTRAEFLLGAMWGALSQIRLAGRTEAAAPLARVVVDTVKSWRE
ncbi:MAG: TetR/AcrR family transcriptional regulator [Pseudomonadota bacterium]